MGSVNGTEGGASKGAGHCLLQLLQTQSTSVATSPQSDTCMDPYIEALSLYICKREPAYQYNVEYLLRQHSKFKLFLSFAQIKYIYLECIAKAIHNEVKTHQCVNNIQISISDFLQTDLLGSIRFHDIFEKKGITQDFHNNRITIICNGNGVKRLRTCNILLDENQAISNMKRFTDLVAELIDMHND